MRRAALTLALTLALALGAGAGLSNARAQVPEVLDYQGVLTDGPGTPVADGTYSITFRLYDSETGSTPLWSETQNVSVAGGIFHALLGTQTSLPPVFDRPLWLGISVGGGPELSPRRMLTAAPYTLNAASVAGTGNVFPGSGNVGVGTTSPAEKLDVAGGVRIGNTTSQAPGTIRWTGSDFEGFDGSAWKSLTATGGASLPAGASGQTLRHDGSSWVASGNLYNDGTNVGVGTTAPAARLHVDGDVAVGSASGTDGSVRVFGSAGSSAQIVETAKWNGGSIRLYDEAGNTTAFLEADANGTGGFFSLRRDATKSAFVVDGNWAGTNEPRVYINGSTQSAIFSMDQTGDASVELPGDAVSSREILDEPGVASQLGLFKSGKVSRGGRYPVAHAFVSPPTSSGYILAIANVTVEIDHVWGTPDSVAFDIQGTNTRRLVLPAGATSGKYVFPVTLNAILDASITNAAWAWITYTSGANDLQWYDPDVKLIYFPTAYGYVESAAAGAGGDSGFARNTSVGSASFPEAIPPESPNTARIQQELARMRARIDALEAQLEAELQKQVGNER